MARWGRAAQLLQLPDGSRVLDLGCAFGFGTRMLVRRYRAFGHDLSAPYIERARRSVPAATFTCGPAHAIPYPDAFFDGVLLLDVLEHLPDERAAVAEIARVLRPGGRLIVSVPHRGALASLDSLNLYHRMLGRNAPPPTDDPSWPQSPVHRHYTRQELEALLGTHFCVGEAIYTGLGIAEPVNLALLLVFLAWLHMPHLYRFLQYLYFGVYLAEDLIETGPRGYHLMVDAQRV